MRSLALAFVAAVSIAPTSLYAAEPLPTREALERLLSERLACAHAPGGAIAGVVSREGRVVAGVGEARPGGGPPVGDTLFEVASVTKLFTGLMLEVAAARREIELDRPVARYLPAGARLPKDGAAITVLDLATHRSGLPRDPKGVDYDAKQNRFEVPAGGVYALLAAAKLEHAPGTTEAYSNLGFAVLGNVVADRARTDYATLLRQRVAQPLGLQDTVIVPAADQLSRLAVGFDRKGRPLPATTGVESAPGASEIRTTVNDILTLLEAATGLRESPLAGAFAGIARPRHEAFVDQQPMPGVRIGIGLGAIVDQQDGRRLVFHGGDRKDGFSAFVGYDPEQRRGVVVLTNSRRQLADVGMSLLVSERPAEPCGDPAPATIAVAPAALTDYAGTYRAADDYMIQVETRTDRKGSRLYAYRQGKPRSFDPIAKDRFFWRDGRVTLDFIRDAHGNVRSVYLQTNGFYLRGEREAR